MIGTDSTRPSVDDDGNGMFCFSAVSLSRGKVLESGANCGQRVLSEASKVQRNFADAKEFLRTKNNFDVKSNRIGEKVSKSGLTQVIYTNNDFQG